VCERQPPAIQMIPWIAGGCSDERAGDSHIADRIHGSASTAIVGLFDDENQCWWWFDAQLSSEEGRDDR